MAVPATESALLLPVPAAELVVSAWRHRYDRSASRGVPAHVTLLYPFVPPEAIDRSVVDRLRALFAGRAPVAFALSEARRFGDAVLYLAPVPPDPIRSLTYAIVDAFPGHPPYGGEFDEVTPHLTVTDSAPLETMAAAEAELTARLPIHCAVPEVWLMACDDAAGPWRVLDGFPLGG